MAKDLTATTLNSFRRHGGFFVAPPLQQQPPFLSVLWESARRFRMAGSRLTPLLMRIYWGYGTSPAAIADITEW